MKHNKKIEKLARRIASWHKTIDRLKEEEVRAWKKPGSLKK